MIEIPLNSTPEQLFTIILDEVIYDCRVIINSRTGLWTMSIASEGVDLVNGVALVGGVDILKQHNLPINNIFLIDTNNTRLNAGVDNLGTAFRLVILTEEELASANPI